MEDGLRRVLRRGWGGVGEGANLFKFLFKKRIKNHIFSLFWGDIYIYIYIYIYIFLHYIVVSIFFTTYPLSSPRSPRSPPLAIIRSPSAPQNNVKMSLETVVFYGSVPHPLPPHPTHSHQLLVVAAPPLRFSSAPHSPPHPLLIRFLRRSPSAPLFTPQKWQFQAAPQPLHFCTPRSPSSPHRLRPRSPLSTPRSPK